MDMNNSCPTPSPWPSCYTVLGAVVVVIVTSCIILWTVFGNLLVIISFLNDRKLRRQHQNWLIISMATADLLVGLLVMPQTLSYNIIGEWTTGLFICELWVSLDVFFATASILNLCVISIDRYWSVTQPLTYPFERTPLQMATFICIAWSVSLCICLPPLIGWRPAQAPGHCLHSKDLGYVLYSAFGSFYIPLLVLIVVYTKIFMVTRQQNHKKLKETARAVKALMYNPKKRQTSFNTAAAQISFSGHRLSDRSHRPPSPPAHAETTSLHELGKPGQNRLSLSNLAVCESPSIASLTPSQNGKSDVSPTNSVAEIQELLGMERTILGRFEERMKAQAQRAKVKARHRKLKIREIQATVVLGLILVAFSACWLPFFIVYVLRPIYEAPQLTFEICTWLGYCNSGLNPIIYTVFNREFRYAFKRTLSKIFPCGICKKCLH